MSGYSTRRVSPWRRTANHAAGVGFATFAVFLLLLVVIWSSVDGRPTGTVRAFEVVFGVSAVLAAVLGILGLAVGALVFPSRGYWTPRDRALPPWGRAARRVVRIGIRLWGVTFMSFVALILPVAIENRVDAFPDWSSDVTGTVFATLTGTGLVVIAVAGLTWLAAEVLDGYREQRPPPT